MNLQIQCAYLQINPMNHPGLLYSLLCQLFPHGRTHTPSTRSCSNFYPNIVSNENWMPRQGLSNEKPSDVCQSPKTTKH